MLRVAKCLLLSVLIVLCFGFSVSAGLSLVYVTVNMDNAPVEIVDFGRYTREDEDHIFSVVQYKNRTERSIEAVAITMIYYGPFNEKEDGVRGISIDILGPYVETRVGGRLMESRNL